MRERHCYERVRTRLAPVPRRSPRPVRRRPHRGCRRVVFLVRRRPPRCTLSPGTALVRSARRGDDRAVPLPIPFKGRPGTDFSFSGLKTAVRRAIEGDQGHRPEDIAASFQRVAFQSLIDRTRRAAQSIDDPLSALVVAGGVAANQVLSAELLGLGEELGLKVVVPPLSLCTDNGAMIAWAGAERLALGQPEAWFAQLDVAPRPRWPLDPDAPKSSGAGAAKA